MCRISNNQQCLDKARYLRFDISFEGFVVIVVDVSVSVVVESGVKEMISFRRGDSESYIKQSTQRLSKMDSTPPNPNATSMAIDAPF